MSIALDIDFKDQWVLILGGGHVAYRKAKQFLKEGALIKIYAGHYIDGFDQLNVVYTSYDGLIHSLDQAIIAIAATNDPLLNQAFIKLANEHHVLTMSIQDGDGQTTHPMVKTNDDELTIAIHTHGACPALNRPLIACIDSKLKRIRLLRAKLKNKAFSTLLMALSIDQLDQLIDGSSKSTMIIYLVHGGDYGAMVHIMDRLVSKTTTTSSNVSCGYAIVSKRHANIDLSDYIDIVIDLGISVIWCSLFWSDGHYHHMIESLLSAKNQHIHWIRLDPMDVLSEGQTPILHTDHSMNENGVIISILYSSYLASQYPNHPYRVYLECQDGLEHVIDQVKALIEP